MQILRDYHAAMGALIMAHDGTLERFTGDGMMVFFNDPVPVENPAERAVRMALTMRDRVGALSVAWKKRGFDLALGIGIAQGYATIGAIGFCSTSAMELSFDVVGLRCRQLRAGRSVPMLHVLDRRIHAGKDEALMAVV